MLLYWTIRAIKEQNKTRKQTKNTLVLQLFDSRFDSILILFNTN